MKDDNSLYLLGKYLGLVFLVPSGAVAGYLLGTLALHYSQWQGWRAVGIVFGVLASLVKLFQELLRDSEADGKRKQS